MINLFKRKINLILIDEETNSVFSDSRIKIDKLPEHFSVGTILHLGDEDWKVVSATPDCRKEIKTLKQLKLVLKKLTKVEVKDILYSISTLSDDCINLTGIEYANDPVRLKNENVYIDPDFWRQIEFVSISQSENINSEFSFINDILNEQKKSGLMFGFKNLRVRSLIKEPLSNVALKLNDIQSFFKIRHKTSIAFPEGNNIISNGFCYVLSDCCSLYGIYNKEETIKFIGILINGSLNDVQHSSLLDFGHKKSLSIVDWVNTRIIV